MHLTSSAECPDIRFSSDTAFNDLYPPAIANLARRHWTPLKVARLAAAFLRSGAGNKILDIGSGAGKFCLASAHYQPDTYYTGVEQRQWLVDHAQTAKSRLRLENAHFVAGNIKDIPFKNFDHFYFYNSFYENLAASEKIDQEVSCSIELFEQYSYYLYKQFNLCPKGTRLVTYHSLETEIPANFHLVQSDINDYLKCWIKV